MQAFKAAALEAVREYFASSDAAEVARRLEELSETGLQNIMVKLVRGHSGAPHVHEHVIALVHFSAVQLPCSTKRGFAQASNALVLLKPCTGVLDRWRTAPASHQAASSRCLTEACCVRSLSSATLVAHLFSLAVMCPCLP